MTSGLGRDAARLAALDVDDPPSPFEPVAVTDRYGPPRGTVDPDRARGWLRRVWPVVASRRALFFGGLLAALGAMVAQVTAPRVLMAAIDQALELRQSSIAPFAWTLLGVAAARGGLTLVYRWSLYRCAYAIEYDLRVAMYQKLTRLSFSFYDRVQSGQLVSRANSDIRAVQMFLTFAPLMALQAFSFVVALGFMLAVHVPLTIVALLPLPFVYVAGMRMRRLMFPISWLVQARLAEVATTVEENVAGVRVVKSFAAEEQQLGLLTRAARRLRWATLRQIDVRATHSPVMENLPRLGMAGVLLYGGLLAVDGAVSVGAIVAFSTYVVMLQAPFRMLGFLMMMSQRAAASAGRIYEVLDREPDITERADAVDLVAPRGAVAYQGVRFSYPDGPPVLDGFDLRVRPGESVALVGRTGTGKSTAARLLPRYYDVDEGAVHIDGRDVRERTLASLRAQVALVTEEPFLFSATLRENIAFGRPDAPLEEVRAAAAAAGAAEFIEELPAGYETVVGERGYTLSGGQRQRIAIARTLLLDPAVLILDDATSAVDVRTEERIHRALREMMRARTTLIVAHRLSTIQLADRVVLLEGGRVAAEGTHAELMRTEPRYAEVLAHIEDEAAARREAHEQMAALDDAAEGGEEAMGDRRADLSELEGLGPAGGELR